MGQSTDIYRGPSRPPVLKLAVNAVNLAPGGGLTVLLGYLGAWRETEEALEISVWASRTPVLEALRELRADIDVMATATDAGLPAREIAQQFTLGPRIAAHGADVVLTTNALVGRCRLPQVVHHQNLLLFARQAASAHPAALLRRRRARTALRRATRNIFISETMRRAAARIVPAVGVHGVVVHNGLDGDLLEQARQVGQQPHREAAQLASLFAVTSDHPHKDNPTLVNTLAALCRMRPDLPWRLDVAGIGGYRTERRLARELRVADRINWLGFIDRAELHARYRQAGCLVFTSRLEGFGYPPLEALALGCPVIAANAAATPEVVAGVSLLVSPENAGAFARAVLRLIDEPILRQNQIRRGLDRAREFSWVTSARALAAVLREAARDRTAA